MSVERIWRAEQLVDGDRTEWGVVADVVGCGPLVKVTFTDGSTRMIRRGEAVTTTKGAA